MHSTILTVSDVSFEYRSRSRGAVTALRGVSFTAEESSLTAVIGPNGSGKSTVFRLITGLLRLQRGEIILDRHLRQDDFGVVFQSPSLDPHLTVFENLAHHSMLYGVMLKREELESRLPRSLEMGDLLDRRVDSLSGGFQRRVELAKVLVTQPRLLVLDEPFTGLDAVARASFFGILRDLTKQGLTALLVTHELELASQCDSVVMLEDGRVVVQASPSELLSDFGETIVEVRSREVDALTGRLSLHVRSRLFRTGPDRLLIAFLSPAEVFAALADCRAAVDHVEVRKSTLNDYFVVKTGTVFRHDMQRAA